LRRGELDATIVAMRLPVLTYHAVLPLEDGLQVRGTVPLSVFEHALPVLGRFGLSATLFVVMGAVDSTTDWYPCGAGK
jgi:hypothetical protein